MGREQPIESSDTGRSRMRQRATASPLLPKQRDARFALACSMPWSSPLVAARRLTDRRRLLSRSRQAYRRLVPQLATASMALPCAVLIREIALAGRSFPLRRRQFACRKGIDARCTGESAPARQKLARSEGKIALPAGSHAPGRPNVDGAIRKFPFRRRTVAGWPGNAGCGSGPRRRSCRATAHPEAVSSMISRTATDRDPTSASRDGHCQAAARP